jgi:hypothetical protein
MARASKSFALIDARNPAPAPISNRFSLDLGGLGLSDDQLSQVRQEAVRAAMQGAGSILLRAGRPGLDDFGTFSTFSTFGSGVERPELQAQPIIDRVVRGG